jgi:hypothetical protein
MKRDAIIRRLGWTLLVAVLAVSGIFFLRSQSFNSTARSAASSQSAAKTPGETNGASREDLANPASKIDWNTWAQRIGTYSARDYETLARAALTIADSARRGAILSEVLSAWLKFDARSFHKFFMALEVANDTEALALLAEALKTALAQVADEIPRSDTLKEIVRRVVAHLARIDPEGALTWASAVLRGDTHDSALVQIVRPLAERSPARALEVIGRISAPLRTMQAQVAAGGAWAKRDPTAAANWADQLTVPTARAMTMNAVLLSIAQANPSDAAQRLANTESLMLQEYVVKFHNALFAVNLTEADVANDTEAYLELRNAGALPPPISPDVELMGDAARVIANKLASGNAQSGTVWAESLETDFLKLTAMRGALAGWSRAEPAAAVAYFATHYPKYSEMLSSIFETWTVSDPAAAAAGIRLVNDAATRAIAIETVARSWAPLDPAKAAGWLNEIPVADRTDGARLAVVSALATVNPSEAWSRAMEIRDPSMQYRALKSAFGAMMSTDPAAARKLLTSAALPAKYVERLNDLLGPAE